MEPVQPLLEETGVGNDHVNITITPGQYEESDERPVGNAMYVKYKKSDSDDWEMAQPQGNVCFAFVALLVLHVQVLPESWIY